MEWLGLVGFIGLLIFIFDMCLPNVPPIDLDSYENRVRLTKHMLKTRNFTVENGNIKWGGLK